MCTAGTHLTGWQGRSAWSGVDTAAAPQAMFTAIIMIMPPAADARPVKPLEHG